MDKSNNVMTANEIMENESNAMEPIEYEEKEKKTLGQKIKENWKTILKVTGIVGGISGLAIFVKRMLGASEEEYIDADYEEIEETEEEPEDK